MDTTHHQLPRNPAALATGFGIGLLWLFLAGTCIWSGVRGYRNGRPDWGFVWILVGLLLGGAGLSAMTGTWRHLTRSHDDY